MSYNFPDAPLVGSVFAPPKGPMWVWDGQVWKGRKEAPASGVQVAAFGAGGLGRAGEGPSGITEATIGDVLPPLGEWNGQLWWESDTGKFFIWFDDGTSSQWVQIIAPIVINDASGTIVTATGGTTPRALADWFAGLGRAEDPPKLGFWADYGPVNIWRFRDRILAGTACVYDGRMNAATETWLGTGEGEPGDGNAGQHWMERSAQMYVGSTEGGIAILGSTRSRDKAANPNHTTVALAGYAYADEGLTGSGDVRGGYFEAARGIGAQSVIFGLDVNTKNLGENILGNAYNPSVAGGTYGLRLASGGDGSLIPAATNNSTAALVIGKNSTRWNKGIIFDSQGVEGTDLAGNGKAIAIEMARGQAIQWRHGSAQNETSAEIRSDNYVASTQTRVVFNTTGLAIRCLDTTQTVELTIAEFPVNGGASAYPSIESGSDTVAIRALGLAPDIDIGFIPKGTGKVVTATNMVVANTSDIPAGGDASKGYMFSTTPSFGVFFGSDQPTLGAAPGSIYLRSDGEVNKHTYINTGSGWIPFLEDVSDKVGLDHIGSGGDSHAVVVPIGDMDMPDGLNGFMSAADKFKLDDFKAVIPGGVPNLMTGADKTRLDGIIPVVPEGPPGLMLGADKSKLDGILPVIPDGIPGLISGTDKTKLDQMTDVESGGDSGFMSGEDKEKLDAIAPVVPDGPPGLMLGADKTKLDAMTAGTGTFIDRVYATPGTSTWSPSVGIVALDVWVQGGGGGGGGATAIVGESAHGSGGGGGGYGFQTYDAVVIAAMGAVALTVGTGGVGGAASNGVGGNGAASSFGILSCAGGFGGRVLGSGTTMAMIGGGTAGTTVSGAQLPISGSPGQFAIRIGTPASAGGGGGGAAGGGSGGADPTTGPGVVGNSGVSGAGGSGAFSYNGTGGAAGGVGGAGYVKVREYY